MPEKYFVECDCGKRVRVELYEAGTERACHSCRRTVPVPDTITLQELSGDKYPLLRPLEKLKRTLELGEAPFDGLCHHCEEADAAFQIPIILNVVVERYMENDGGIRPTISPTLKVGIKLVAAEAEEYSEETTFPLLLCAECHAVFESAQEAAGKKRMLGLFALLGLLVAFLVFAYFNAEVVALLSGILWLIGAIAWASRFRDTKKIDSFIKPWLNDIRWFPEVLALEDEYTLSIGDSEIFRENTVS